MGAAQEFREFITRGNVIDLAVGFIIGAAFTALVTALVVDIFTPLIGVVFHVDFSSLKYTVNSSTFLPGLFLNALISFILVALVVFFAIVRPVAKMEERRKARAGAAPPTTKTCPECQSTVPIAATRCAFCTQPIR